MTHKFRFTSIGTASSALSPVLAGGLLNVATSTSLAVTLLKTIRLLRVEVWGYTANTTDEIIPQTGNDISFAQTVISDTCRDASRPCHLVWLPRDVKFRDIGETDAWCVINHNTNDVVDLTFSFTLDVNGNHLLVNTGASGLTAGVLYQGQIDGPLSVGKLRNIHGPNWV